MIAHRSVGRVSQFVIALADHYMHTYIQSMQTYMHV